MRNIVRRTVGSGSHDQSGLTLIELLIVVGIVVAMVGVIIPLVIQFAGKGDEGANAAEEAAVQTAINDMMAVNTTQTITERAVAAVVADADEPYAGDPMSNYMRDLPTVCSYTWLDNGLVTQAPCP